MRPTTLPWWQRGVVYQIYSRSYQDASGDGAGDLAGIRIVLDVVPNHTSDQHPWFVEARWSRDHPRRDWSIRGSPKPDGSAPTNWRGVDDLDTPGNAFRFDDSVVVRLA